MKKNVIKMKPAMKTPVTYYGGKQRMLSIILPMIPQHQIYVEPFMGGGAVFFAKEPAKVELINDKNGEVVNFYNVVKTRFPELKALVDATLHSEKQQKEAKHIYFHPDDFDEVRRAWALWVLSHQSFYSILGNTWKCSKVRSTAVQLLARRDSFTDAYCARLERTSIFCRDALDVIRKANRDDAFHYVDPPYFNADMGHCAGFTIEDFKALLDTLANVRGKFMLSSYPSDVLREYTQAHGWRTYEYQLPRSAGGGSKVEVLTLNYTPPAEIECSVTA